MTAEQDQKQAPVEAAPQGQLGIQRIYVKDSSFEAPHSPGIFREQLNPTLDLHFGNATASLGEDLHEVVLTVTATVKDGERAVYLVEVKQAGIFQISGFPSSTCRQFSPPPAPTCFSPSPARLCDVVVKGGFPQLLIAPINFEALYAQELQRRRQSEQATAH